MLHYFRLVGLLARAARLNVEPDDGRIARRPLVSKSALDGDVWEPRAGATETLVAAHGASLKGKDEPRLQAFARSMAASGIRCVVPTLPGLSQMQFLASDADALAALAQETAESYARPVLIGFSFGGSCALLGAARSKSSVRYVLSFGAAHDYARLFDELCEKWRAVPADPRLRSERLYVLLMLTFRNAAQLGLREDLAPIASALGRFCQGLPQEEAQALERRLEPLAPVDAEHRYGDRAALRAASPAGQLAGLCCPTGLVHDPNDLLVPVDHAHALHRELEGLGARGSHRLLVTSLFEHVDLKRFRFSDLSKLLRILEPLVSSAAG